MSGCNWFEKGLRVIEKIIFKKNNLKFKLMWPQEVQDKINSKKKALYFNMNAFIEKRLKSAHWKCSKTVPNFSKMEAASTITKISKCMYFYTTIGSTLLQTFTQIKVDGIFIWIISSRHTRIHNFLLIAKLQT